MTRFEFVIVRADSTDRVPLFVFVFVDQLRVELVRADVVESEVYAQLECPRRPKARDEESDLRRLRPVERIERGIGSEERENSGFRRVRDVSNLGTRCGQALAVHTDHSEKPGVDWFDQVANWPATVRNVSKLGSQIRILQAGFEL